MFELRFARNLFENNQFESNEEIKNNIEETNIQDILNGLIGMISHDFRDILLRLLQKDPQKRASLQDLKAHPFFKEVKWEDIL